MITAEVNAPFPNRIQLLLNDFTGPFTSARLGLFDPSRDLEIYVDGDPLTVQAFTYDAANNRYLIYAPQTFDLQGTIQVTYHLPDPVFTATGGGGTGVVSVGPENPASGTNSGAGSPPSPDTAWTNPANITLGLPTTYATLSLETGAGTPPFFNFANVPGTHHITASYTFNIGQTLPTWSPSNPYSVGALIVDSNGNVQRATTAGTSNNVGHPVWATGIGATTPDGATLVWTCVKYIITQGDTIVLNPFWGGGTITSLTDVNGDAWTPLAAQQTAGAGYDTQAWITTANANIPYGSSLSVTVDYSTVVNTDVTWATFSNLSAPSDVVMNTSGSNVPSWESSISVAQASVFLSISTSVVTATVAAPFTQIAENEAGNNSFFAYYGGDGGAQTATATWTVESSGTSTFSSLLISFPYMAAPPAQSQLLIAEDYGFAIPEGPTVEGVQVSITGQQSGGTTSIVFDQQTTPTTGTGTSISLGPLTPAQSGEWAVFTGVFDENSNTFPWFPQGGGSAVTAYTISGGTITVTGTNNLVPGQVVLMTGTGAQADGYTFTVATANGSGWTATTSLPNGSVGGAVGLASVQGWVNLTGSGGTFYSASYLGIWGAPIGSASVFPPAQPLVEFDGGSKNWMGSLLLFETNGSTPASVNAAKLGSAGTNHVTFSVTQENVMMIWGVVNGPSGDPVINDTQGNDYVIVSDQNQTITGQGLVKNYVAIATMSATGINTITISQAYTGPQWVAMANELQNVVVPSNTVFTVTPNNPVLGAESHSFQLISGNPGNTTVILGSPTDTWGMPWSTAAAINAQDFGFTVQATNPNTFATAFSVSQVQVTVYYQSVVNKPVPSFALIPAYTTAGDQGLTPTAVLAVSPSTAQSGQPVTLIWNTTNVAYVGITASGFNTGYLSTTGTGIYFVASGFNSNGSPPSHEIVFTLAAYDVNKNAIIVDAVPLVSTATLTLT